MPEFTTNEVFTTNAVTPTKVDVAMATLQTLLNLATGVTAVIGGVSTPVIGGIAIAQSLMPVVSRFIITIGDSDVVMDVSKVTTDEVVKAMQKDIDAGFPVLSFTNKGM